MVAGRGLLFKGRLVFLIDDDQSQVARGREDRAPGADDDLHAPGGDFSPVPGPVGVLQVAMEDRDVAIPPLEGANGLRRQADFRDQHQRLFALAHHFADSAQVQLRFAAAGDPVQKDRLEPTLPNRLFQDSPDFALWSGGKAH